MGSDWASRKGDAHSRRPASVARTLLYQWSRSKKVTIGYKLEANKYPPDNYSSHEVCYKSCGRKLPVMAPVLVYAKGVHAADADFGAR
jgi:hypothetical protein